MPDQELTPDIESPATLPEAHPTGAPPAGALLDSPPGETSPPAETDSTVGTGTSIALGCVVGTIVLIVFGLIFLGIVALNN